MTSITYFMNKKNIILISIVAVIIVVGIVFYAQNQRQDTKESAQLSFGKTIIGYVVWPGYLGLYIANEKGYFEKAGLNVEIRAYPSLFDMSKDDESGKIQGVANLTLDAINEVYRGLDHKIVLTLDYSNGADGIIASRNTQSLKDAKGKRVAFEHGTLEEFFITYALDQDGLRLKDIVPINLNAEESAKAVVKGNADIAVTYEPYMSKALAESDGHKIYTSADAPGLITDVLTFREDFINEHSKAIEVIIREYFRAINFWKEHPEEANVIIAKYLGIAPEEVPAILQGISMIDLKENRTAFTFAAGLQSLYGNLRSIGEFVWKQNYKDKKRIDTDILIEPRFIRNLLRNE